MPTVVENMKKKTMSCTYKNATIQYNESNEIFKKKVISLALKVSRGEL